jgi:hypothetical protein
MNNKIPNEKHNITHDFLWLRGHKNKLFITQHALHYLRPPSYMDPQLAIPRPTCNNHIAKTNHQI